MSGIKGPGDERLNIQHGPDGAVVISTPDGRVVERDVLRYPDGKPIVDIAHGVAGRVERAGDGVVTHRPVVSRIDAEFYKNLQNGIFDADLAKGKYHKYVLRAGSLSVYLDAVGVTLERLIGGKIVLKGGINSRHPAGIVLNLGESMVLGRGDFNQNYSSVSREHVRILNTGTDQVCVQPLESSKNGTQVRNR